MDSNETLKWRFDISTFRLIGRDLITDRITALFELVKNCYDANAEQVIIIFHNVREISATGDASIKIVDDGFGMSFEDVQDKWMVIGTSNKRKNPYSAEPYNRKCVGEKGIGRFAVDKLGDRVNILTKKEGSNNSLNIEIDWSEYYKESHQVNDIKLFTDVENKYNYITSTETKKSGTTIHISKIREVWTKNDIERFIKEVSKIVSPYAKLAKPFIVRVEAEEFGINKVATSSIDDVNLATLGFAIDFQKKNNIQESVVFDVETNQIRKEQIPIRSFGGIKMQLFYFDDSARRKYRKEFPNNQIDGIKIYRDGIITTPFAETENDADKKRDILGIDKRLWQDLFNRVSTREIIGIVEISKDDNANIIDATNRQDFVDNKEYKELKEFIILQLDAIEKYKIASRNNKKQLVHTGLEGAKSDIDTLIRSATEIAENNPELKSQISPFIEQASKTGRAVKTAIEEHRKTEEEFIRKENIYMSIMSLQEYAIHITHAVRTTLNKIERKADFFADFYPDPNEESFFKLYAIEMSKEIKLLNKVIDYMLSYSQSNIKPEDVNIQYLISNIFDSYSVRFETSGIRIQRSLSDRLILNTNKQFFIDIIQNIVDNSIKAVSNTDVKIIKCSAFVEEEKLIIQISDTGVGIPVEKRDWVFGLYNTTTEESGGGGVGLYIVKTRVESLHGTVKIVDSEFGNIGATVRIELPFKK